MLEIEENNCKALYRLATAHANLGNYDEADAWLHKAMVLEPNNADVIALQLNIRAARQKDAQQAKLMSAKVFGQHAPRIEAPKCHRSLVNSVLAMITSLISFVIGAIVGKVCGFLISGKDFAMSFCIIRVPVTIFLLLPYRILRGLLGLLFFRSQRNDHPIKTD